MKKLLSLMLPWLLAAQSISFPGPGTPAAVGSSFSIVHYKFCHGTATGQACSLGFTSDSANIIIIAWHQYDGTAATNPTFGDGLGTTYANLAASSHLNGAFSYSYGYGQWWGKPSGAITSITPNFTGGAGKTEYYVLEVSGLSATPTDTGINAVGNGSTSFTSTATPPAASTAEIAICFAVDRVHANQVWTVTGAGTWAQISQDQDSVNTETVGVWYQKPLAATTPSCSGTLTATSGFPVYSVGVYK